MPDLKLSIQRPGESDRYYPRRADFPNHRLGSATRGFRSNSAADQSGIAIFKKTISPPAVFHHPDLPASDQRSHLRFHGGDDGGPDHDNLRFGFSVSDISVATKPIHRA